ncbi:MAG: 16S rRNA (cytosine(1402)-N(4))-methyltransferase RsmH [Ruminococcus sp.]|nr:16S rRNA (cytosine(1402)-N(4))-methyltransferase RsmH [Ruminococcus sp.]MBQ8906173.1 16S rRNA (cytosine(1402)-N(4))-methyltransferase RsmH [Ruminococcus sp.]
MDFHHISVLPEETLSRLGVRPDGIYVDGTVGGAGHASMIAAQLGDGGRLIALDRDPDAIAVANKRLAGYPATVVNANFSEMRQVLDDLNISQVDGILLDLGVSSHQLDTQERGFSYHMDAPLDMRMSQSGVSAGDIVNTASEAELARILFEYGEEKYARGIAARIVAAREAVPITTTLQLAELIKAGVPAKVRREKNPCKKSFQAIRIAVNGELDHLAAGLEAAFYSLKSGGRLAVITFHSLEDRLVKQKFAAWCQGCTCPKEFPICVCGKTPEGRLVNRKPIEAGQDELERNNRSRSAKLRVIERS